MSDDIQAAFEVFDAANPEVYNLFKRFAAELRRVGRTKHGAKSILERIRWEYATTGRDADGFKINNNFTSRYARKLVQEDPSYDSFFERRKCGGDPILARRRVTPGGRRRR